MNWREGSISREILTFGDLAAPIGGGGLKLSRGFVALRLQVLHTRTRTSWE